MSYAANSKVNSPHHLTSSTKLTRLPLQAPTDGKVIQEGTGVITSDSLAAESLKSGGDFGKGQGAAASGVPSKSTTANTTDTSGATILKPAVDAAHRDDDSSASAVPSKPYNTTAGGPQTSLVSSGSGAAAGTTSGSSHDKPKGTNITERGFDSSAPNASFNNEIGTKNDPGRVAEAKFEADAAMTGGEGSYPGSGDDKLHGGKGGFEHLNPQKEA